MTTTEDARDREDMARLAGGHDAALNDLLDRHAAGVQQFLFRMLGQAEDAEDLAQETFVRLYQARAQYRPGQPFKSWLYTIAANLARNRFRWRRRHPNVPLEAAAEPGGQSLADVLPDPGLTPGDTAELRERAVAVQAAVQRLPEEQRQVIVLCELEDFSLAEAAGVLDLTPKAVESHLYRARQALREKLKRWLAS